jgi:hypothetical protein
MISVWTLEGGCLGPHGGALNDSQASGEVRLATSKTVSVGL